MTIYSKQEFRAARLRLQLSVNGAAAILNINERQIRRWESEGDPVLPSPIACRVFEWMLDCGWRPPQFQTRTQFGRKPKELQP